MWGMNAWELIHDDALEAALFDFDGTLCDTERLNTELAYRNLRSLGVELPFEEAAALLLGASDDDVVPGMLERAGSSATFEDYARLQDWCMPTYRDAEFAPAEGAVELLRRLRGRGVKTAVVSSTPARCVLMGLDRTGLLPLFDAVVCGDMVSCHKPDPEPYELGLALLGARARNSVVFEDSVAGVSAGNAAGCRTVGVKVFDMGQDLREADAQLGSYLQLVVR